jgi:hypothetical protein
VEGLDLTLEHSVGRLHCSWHSQLYSRMRWHVKRERFAVACRLKFADAVRLPPVCDTRYTLLVSCEAGEGAFGSAIEYAMLVKTYEEMLARAIAPPPARRAQEEDHGRPRHDEGVALARRAHEPMDPQGLRRA